MKNVRYINEYLQENSNMSDHGDSHGHDSGHGKHHKGHELLEKILSDLSPKKIQPIKSKHTKAHNVAYKDIKTEDGLKRTEILDNLIKYSLKHDIGTGIQLKGAISDDGKIKEEIKDMYRANVKAFLESYGRNVKQNLGLKEEDAFDIYSHIQKEGLDDVINSMRHSKLNQGISVKKSAVWDKHAGDLDFKTKGLIRDAYIELKPELADYTDEQKVFVAHNIEEHVLAHVDTVYKHKPYAKKEDASASGGAHKAH